MSRQKPLYSMKNLLRALILAAITFAAGCASPKLASGNLQEPFDFNELQRMFQNIAKTELEFKKKNEQITTFINEGKRRSWTARDERLMVKLSEELGVLRANLAERVIAYNNKVLTVLSRNFARYGLPTSIQFNLSTEVIIVPRGSPKPAPAGQL